MKFPTLVLLFLGLTFRLANAAMPPGDTEFPFERAVLVLSQTLANAPSIEIYEGLAKDPAVASSQRQKNSVRQITDQWFYSVPDEIRMKHAMKLQRLVGSGLIQPWREAKFCGGFHADYAIAVTFPKVTMYMLFCFSCHEARLVREANPFAAELSAPDFRVTMDISDKSFEELRSLLVGYHNSERDGGGPGG